MLAFKRCNALLCRQLKTRALMNRQEKFDALCRELTGMDKARLAAMDFGRLCRSLDAEEVEMDNMMYASFGICGQEALEMLSR